MCRIMYDVQGCAKCAKYFMIHKDVQEVQYNV
jgi:hypothetical protein